MIATTPEFKTAISAYSRVIKAKVRINFTDVLLDPSVVATSTDENRISRTEQAVNSRINVPYKWMSLSGESILDGSFHPAPGTEDLAAFNEVGYWSDSLSDGSSEFSPEVPLIVTFTARNVSSVLIAGDDSRLEYPVDFTLTFYKLSVLIDTVVVTDNTEVRREVFFESFIEDTDEVRISISKWSHPNRCAKIAEFSTALAFEFGEDLLREFTVTEQREISNNNSIPIGNIASSELDLSLINFERWFDANNEDSPLVGVVKPNAKIEIEIGVLTSNGVEYIPLFVGWSGGWKAPDASITASTSARDRLDLLTKSKITTSTVQANLSFYDWFELVFNDAGIANDEFLIDPTLGGADYVVPYGWFDNVSHRKALELLATGCAASVYQDKTGILRVEASDFLAGGGIPQSTFSRDDYKNKDNQPIYENVVNQIRVTTQPLVQNTGQTVYQTTDSEQEEIDASTTEEYTIFYSVTPVTNASISINPSVSGVSIDSSEKYSWGAVVTVTNSNAFAETFKFEVTGTVYEVQGKQTVTRSDQTSIAQNGVGSFTFPVNQFLQSKKLASSIADSLLASFKDPQRDLTISFEPGGDPSLELSDSISVTDRYQTKDYALISNVISFNGGLSIQHKGRVV